MRNTDVTVFVGQCQELEKITWNTNAGVMQNESCKPYS